MSQRSIREYYSFRKKKLSSTFHKQNEEKTSTPAKKQKVDDGLLDSELIQATVDRLFMPQQASLVIDTETNSPIASNSRTTLDPIKSPEKSPCAPQSEEQDVFKRPVSPASKAKRKLEQAPCVKQSESKRFKDAAIFGGQQSILKWAKNTNKWNRILNPGYPNSDLIKVIPRQLPDLVLPVRLSPVAAAPSPTANSSIECKAKKRLEDETASPRSLSPPNLNSPPAKDRGLELPKKYLQLATTFNHLETVITIMYNRQETCTFDKAKQGVQKLTKKDFDLSHLAQILTIYPNAYKLNYEKLTSIGRLNVTWNGLQLVIKPNVLSNKMIPYTSQMRRNEFNENLLRFAKKAHCDYLRSLDEPVPVDGTELVRWHPSFIFPNVSEAELPEQPVENEATRSIRKFWSKLNFEHSGDNLKPVPGAAGHMCVTEGARIKIKEGVLKGLSQGFLDKVSVI